MHLETKSVVLDLVHPAVGNRRTLGAARRAVYDIRQGEPLRLRALERHGTMTIGHIASALRFRQSFLGSPLSGCPGHRAKVMQKHHHLTYGAAPADDASIPATATVPTTYGQQEEGDDQKNDNEEGGGIHNQAPGQGASPVLTQIKTRFAHRLSCRC